jgi:phosphate transport system permease protein
MAATSQLADRPADSSPGRGIECGAQRGDRIFAGIARGSGIAVIVLVALVAAFLITTAAPSLYHDHTKFLYSRQWDLTPGNLRFGVAGMFYSTVLISAFAMLLALPIAVGVALFLTCWLPRKFTGPPAALIDLLAAVPSIVYGIWGIYVLSPTLQPFAGRLEDALAWCPLFAHTGVSRGTIFVGGVVLAIMILPIVTAVSREVFAQVPQAQVEAALGLGATRWEMVRLCVLPFGRSGVVSAAMLGLGRALGETIAVTLILSSPPTGAPFRASLFNGGETFASKIANNAQEFDSPAKAGAFLAAGLMLFLLTFTVNVVARAIVRSSEARVR